VVSRTGPCRSSRNGRTTRPRFGPPGERGWRNNSYRSREVPAYRSGTIFSLKRELSRFSAGSYADREEIHGHPPVAVGSAKPGGPIDYGGWTSPRYGTGVFPLNVFPFSASTAKEGRLDWFSPGVEKRGRRLNGPAKLRPIGARDGNGQKREQRTSGEQG